MRSKVGTTWLSSEKETLISRPYLSKGKNQISMVITHEPGFLTSFSKVGQLRTKFS
jgi:hypothetical protein